MLKSVVVILSTLAVSVSGRRSLKVSGGFEEIRRCDSCLALAQELVNGCARVKPPKMLTEVWVGELIEKGISRGVTKWTWSQPRGYDQGRYKTNEELLLQYKDSPDAQRMLRDATKKPPEKKDTQRFNFLSQIVNEVEEELEEMLGKCSEDNRSYDEYSKLLCKYTCHKTRLGGDKYPDPAIVKHLQETAARLYADTENTGDGWTVMGKTEGEEKEQKTAEEDANEEKEETNEEL